MKKIGGKLPEEVTNDYLSGYTERVTGAVKGISSDHASVHSALGYSASYYVGSILNTAQSTIAFITPATSYVHLKMVEMWTDQAAIKCELFEGVGLTGGTTLTSFNRRRVAPVASSNTNLYSESVATTVGPPIETTVYGGGGANVASRVGADKPTDLEFVLAPSTSYAFITTNISGSTAKIFTWLFWYEEEYA